MNSRGQAVRLVVARVLKDMLAAADNSERDAVREAWTVGDRIGAPLGGLVAGHVLFKRGSTKVTVTDLWAC